MTSRFFVIDVESVGLYGEAFAVACGLYIDGVCQWESRYACDMEACSGRDSDRKWVRDNVPLLPETHSSPRLMRNAFWKDWLRAADAGAVMAADCAWPVEARFLAACVGDEPEIRNWTGPYPLAEISSYMAAAGMDPMADYSRTASELPKHEPLADVRQSARLLFEAISKIKAAA